MKQMRCKGNSWLAILAAACLLMVVLTGCKGGVQSSPTEQDRPTEQGTQTPQGETTEKVEAEKPNEQDKQEDQVPTTQAPTTNEEKPPITEYLEYSPRGDGTYGVKLGTAQYPNEISIPETYNGMAVTEILPEAFNNATNLKKIQIPDSIIQIGEKAFAGCTSLTEMRIPEGVTELPRSAFNGCTALSKITLPGSLSQIEDGLFEDFISLTEVILSDGITEIGRYAFMGCTNLTNVIVPDSVHSILMYAFTGCDDLELTYSGTVSQWKAIERGYLWGFDRTHTIHCTDGDTECY